MEPHQEDILRKIHKANNRIIDEVTQEILASSGEGEELAETARFAQVPTYSGLRIDRHHDTLCLPKK